MPGLRTYRKVKIGVRRAGPPLLRIVKSDPFLRKLREENAKALHVSLEALDEMEIRALEERLGLDDKPIGPPMETMGGLPSSELYILEPISLQAKRKVVMEKLARKFGKA